MNFPVQFKEIKLRPEQEEDYVKMKKFHDPLIDEQTLIGRKEKRSLGEWKESITTAVKKQAEKQAVLLVAECQEKIVGLAAIFIEQQKASHVGVLGIMLAKPFRKIGLGSKLMETLINWAQESLPGLQCIELGVSHNNFPAQKLYQKFGFRTVAVLPNRINQYRTYLDEHIMHLWIQAPAVKK